MWWCHVFFQSRPRRSQNTLMFIREEQDACREGQGSYKTRYGSVPSEGQSDTGRCSVSHASVEVVSTRAPRLHRRHHPTHPRAPPPTTTTPCVLIFHPPRAVDVVPADHMLCVLPSPCFSYAHLTPASCASFQPLPRPLPVCRNISKQTFLETLQDNLIEMDILASAGHDAGYNDGYVACSPSPPPHPPRLPPPAHAFRVRICFAIVNNSDACFYYSIKHPRVPGGAVNHPRATGLPLYLSLSCFSAANNLHYVALLGCASFDYRGAWGLCETPCSFLVTDVSNADPCRNHAAPFEESS